MVPTDPSDRDPAAGLPDGAASRAGTAEPPFERRRPGTERRARDRQVLAVIEEMSDAFLALDRAWRVSYANREAVRLSGMTADALLGRDHWETWPETRGSEVERQYRRAVAEQRAVSFEHHYPGAGVWHEVRAYPTEEGGLAVFYRDITGRKQLEAERARQARELATAHDRAMAAETHFRLLVDRVRDYAVFLIDPEGIITHWGPGAERMHRWSAGEAVGMHLRTLYPDRGPAEDGSAEDHLRHAALHGEYIGEGTRVRRGTEPFQARTVLTALRLGGRLVGFSEIAQDLTGERERATLLEQAMATAEAANTAKSQFLANTSHEIRTPLNAIIGYAQLLELGLAGALTDGQRQYVTRIQATSQHLLSLVNDVLDLSKIEAGAMQTVREAGLVHDVLASALQLVEPQARARRMALVNACAESSGTAYCGDVERVRQVLVNLLSNAVRFTEVGGRVTVTCGEAPSAPPEVVASPDARARPWTLVRVEDTGVGIAPDQLDRIWEAFVQVDAARTRRIGGSGLGLTISRHLARLMGGDITVRSQPGLGSSFVLWLPAAEPRDAPRVSAGAGQGAVAPRDPERALHEDGGPALRELADRFLSETERVLATYVARLRRDPGTPSAHAMGESQLQDHAVTLIADLAQCLAIVADDGPEAERMLRDGSSIQAMIAERHGAQRAHLGWRADEVRRDYAVLREEVHAALTRASVRVDGPVITQARGVLDHFLSRAERLSLEAHGDAR